MADFSAGIATFTSCDKAGSIPHFTRHLEQNPNDYKAYFWRGRAYSIIGNKPRARADFIKALSVSTGANKLLADAELANLDGDQNRKVSILQNTAKDYPMYEDAYGELGSVYLHMGNIEEAYHHLTKAVSIAKYRDRTSEPSYCWYQHALGNILLRSKHVDEAAISFKAAIKSCKTHTVSHLGCCKTYIVKDENILARESFSMARSLNPNLVEWETFESFRDWFNANGGNEIRDRYQVQNQTSHVTMTMVNGGKRGKRDTENASNEAASGGQRGGSGGDRDGGGSGRNSSGSDDEGNGDDKWKTCQKESKCILKDSKGQNRYVQSKCGKFWYSRDKAGHAGAFVKVFEDKAKSLNFSHSLDRRMNPMVAKHESREGLVIKKSDLVVVWRR